MLETLGLFLCIVFFLKSVTSPTFVEKTTWGFSTWIVFGATVLVFAGVSDDPSRTLDYLAGMIGGMATTVLALGLSVQELRGEMPRTAVIGFAGSFAFLSAAMVF
jgi:hypothetical protein